MADTFFSCVNVLEHVFGLGSQTTFVHNRTPSGEEGGRIVFVFLPFTK